MHIARAPEQGTAAARCDSPGRRSQFPVLYVSIRSSMQRSSAAAPTKCRRPGSTRPILDSSIANDYNNRPIPMPSEGAAGQVNANSVDRRTRESLIVYTHQAEDVLVDCRGVIYMSEKNSGIFVLRQRGGA